MDPAVGTGRPEGVDDLREPSRRGAMLEEALLEGESAPLS